MKTTQQSKERQKIILTIIAISFAIGVIAGLTVGLIVNALNTSASATNDDYEYISEAAHSADESNVTADETKDAIHRVSLGKFRLTAYCPCEKCCGIWAKNRPTDIDGKPIVKTASGQIAKQGYTIAADKMQLPFGTKVYINGHEYEVQDVGGAIKENSIDIYFESHQEALEFGVKYEEVYIEVRVTDEAEE